MFLSSTPLEYCTCGVSVNTRINSKRMATGGGTEAGTLRDDTRGKMRFHDPVISFITHSIKPIKFTVYFSFNISVCTDSNTKLKRKTLFMQKTNMKRNINH